MTSSASERGISDFPMFSLRLIIPIGKLVRRRLIFQLFFEAEQVNHIFILDFDPKLRALQEGFPERVYFLVAVTNNMF